MLEVFNYAFFSGITCCGLAVLRGTKLGILKTCFISSFCCSSVFIIISKTNNFTVAAFLSTIVAAGIVKYFSNLGKHGFLFIVIPSIYCITPGNALYKMFFAGFNQDIVAFATNAIYIAKVSFGCYIGILTVEFVFEKIKSFTYNKIVF